ncbi:hypothetical protein X975_14767, partial [Stegodyphus mimosarum]
MFKGKKRILQFFSSVKIQGLLCSASCACAPIAS